MLVQPYCVLDLSALIRAQRHLIPQRIVKGLFAQMAWGLAACHASGARAMAAYQTLCSAGSWQQRQARGPCATLPRSLLAPHAASGVMHRDLKPSNVLLSAEGVAMLADWGLGRPMAPDPGPGERPPQYTHTVATRW